jgi:DNA-binding LacI/PurR family transcriptional regulator
MRPRLTMSDIGKLAGVSASTVSRALNNSSAIPKATRDRILKIAHEHNYVLDARAQNFRLRRSKTIATVFPYMGQSRRLISDPFYLEITGAVTDALADLDYDMILARVPSVDDGWCLRYVMNRRVDGLILIDRAVKDPTIETLLRLGADFVVWGPPLPGQDCISVGGDSVAGAALAVRHLAGLGRRRIGFIGGHGGMAETYLRRQGYEQGLQECGLPCDERLVAYTDFTPQAGHTAMMTLLERQPELDAVFICSDFMSVAAMEVLRGSGRQVPADVSVVGYDDIPLAAYCTPRLTTIRQQIQAGGRLLVEKLFDLVEGRPTASAVLPVELIVRDSCGAKPNST